MAYLLNSYNREKDKSILFFSAASPRDSLLLMERGIKEQLVSYHYIKKRMSAYLGEVLPEIIKSNTWLMTDSGAFSFLNAEDKGDYFYKEEYWLPYLEEYCQWLHDNKGSIFSAANLDLEGFVGYDVVDRWNEKYFKPLEKYMQISYVAHANDGTYDALQKRFIDYCRRHPYVGISSTAGIYEKAAWFFLTAKQHDTRVHGFGWTSIPVLKRYPFFSVDSSTWLGGVRYGTTYFYDGKNFKVLPGEKKFRRKQKFLECREADISFTDLMHEERDAVNSINIEGWKGARKEYLKFATLKLTNRNVGYYAK